MTTDRPTLPPEPAARVDPAPASTSDDAEEQPSTLVLDARALRVLAHPLRSRLLSALRTGGPANATTLASALGTNTGATSYHLRKLASVGLVTETGAGHGRERWWRAATRGHSWTERDVAADPDGQAATDWLRRHYFRAFVERYGGWLDAEASWPLAWRDCAGASDDLLRLTPTRLRQLQDDVMALIRSYRADGADDSGDSGGRGGTGNTGAEQVAVYFHAFPTGVGRRG